MSELKEYTADDIQELDDKRLEESESGKIDCTRVYIKSEADNVIADLKKENEMTIKELLIEISELKEKYKELAKLHDKAIQACCDADKVIAHHKYRRCLDKAEMCKAWYVMEDIRVNGHCASWDYTRSEEMKYWERWQKRWLELAEKFKPNT